MSFSEQYAALEGKFKEQVEKDNEDLGIDSCFLANVAPKAQVDYVLVAMEPSRPANIASIKNFAVSVEDFILHFCASKYLCKGTPTYPHHRPLKRGDAGIGRFKQPCTQVREIQEMVFAAL